MQAYIVSYAQNKEDILLDGLTGGLDKGFYVDVGASDPDHLSVTKYFYDKGWSGINIEPIPGLYKKLVKARPRDINLQIGIGDKKGSAKLHYYPHGDGLSTFSQEMVAQYANTPLEATEGEQILTIDVYPLAEVLKKYADSRTINFMKIDVEGYEAQAIKGNDWTKYRPQIICIEVEHVFNAWEKELISRQYTRVFFDGINNYYVAEEAKSKLKPFSYEHTILDRPVVQYGVANQLEQTQDRLKDYEKTAVEYEVTLQRLKSQSEQRVAELEFEMSRPKSIKQAIRIMLRAIHYKTLNLIGRLKPASRIYIPTKGSISPQELLSEINVYDSENEKILNTTLNIRMLPYIVVSSAYSFFARCGIKILAVAKGSMNRSGK